MKKIVIVILVLVARMACAAQPVPVPVKILSAEFGLFSTNDSGEQLFEPAQVVAHRVGQRYGWIIEVSSARRLSVREEYLLPNTTKPATDPLSESLSVPLQRRNQVSQRQLVPVEGRIYGEWAIGPNEPAGHRHLQVVIEDQVAASFEFDVK
ncbi:MAG: hypothetical protein H6R17_3908 [Proteobacteria bacterium]|nr:hypothetical protein [Pseudomonadota bacterium]